MSLNASTGGARGENDTIFVPLSLVVNPDLPAALLGEKKDGPSNSPQARSGRPPSGGDGLHTEMSIPTDTEVVNMADLDKDEFFGLIGNAGLATTKR
jgi:hypothetical protein